jgi:hypothetical protein
MAIPIEDIHGDGLFCALKWHEAIFLVRESRADQRFFGCDVHCRGDAKNSVQRKCIERPLRRGNDGLRRQAAPLETFRYGKPDFDIAVERTESDVTDQRPVHSMFDRQNVGTQSGISRIRILGHEKLDHRMRL